MYYSCLKTGTFGHGHINLGGDVIVSDRGGRSSGRTGAQSDVRPCVCVRVCVRVRARARARARVCVHVRGCMCVDACDCGGRSSGRTGTQSDVRPCVCVCVCVCVYVCVCVAGGVVAE